MNTVFLETFLLVTELGSMAETARKLAITPAAVAQRISALEADLGVALIERSGRKVQPTDAGRAIIASGNQILVEVRKLRITLRADGDTGELRLGAISTAMSGILPNALHNLSEHSPGIEVFILPGTSPAVYSSVLEDRVDGGILVQPPFALPKSLEWISLRREPLVLICPQVWADMDAMTLLNQKRFIRYDRNNWGGRLADRWMKEHRITAKEWLELDQLEAISVMVSNGLGVSIVPDWAPPWPEGLEIKKINLPGERPPMRDIGLLRKRSTPSGRLLEKLSRALS
jgi:DNA-binding transcriptional LysR family regulator